MIVVADTSVLINLACVEQIELLRSLFHDVIVPPEVAAEFARLAADVSRFKGVTLPNWIRQQSPTTVPPSLNAMAGLDAGEFAALSLAVEIRADAILIDERRGHSAASQLGLTAIGVLGVLIQAKAAGLVPLIRPIIDDLDRTAGFFMSQQLRNQILRLAGE